MFTHHNPFYLDCACTTPTLKVATDTYTKFAGTCLGRANYPLAIEAQEMSLETRKQVKQWFNIPAVEMDDWQVVFGYNTTDLINKIKISIKNGFIKIETGIGHNSVSLQDDNYNNSSTLVKQLKLKVSNNLVIRNTLDGLNVYPVPHIEGTWGNNIISVYSNIDGLLVDNSDIHPVAPIVICDLAQGFFSFDKKVEKNQIYIFSAHKIYSTHLGVALVHKDILNQLIPPFIGGGAIAETDGREYRLYTDEEAYKSWECGLSDTGSICALGETIKELTKIDARSQYKQINLLTKYIKSILIDKGFEIASTNPDKHSSIVSFYDPKDLTRHIKIGEQLNNDGIACRTGGCCAESWLKANGFPHIVRLSLGLNYTYTGHNKVLTILNKL